MQESGQVVLVRMPEFLEALTLRSILPWAIKPDWPVPYLVMSFLGAQTRLLLSLS